ncbi:MAG: hypothetical protein HOV83_05220 [Catenulispora sp.]|nr:hypothetical protein [Catenulispora sp.]
MRGAMVVIDLPGPVPAERLAELGAVLRGFGGRFEEARIGSYDVEIEPGRLGVADGEGGGGRPFRVNITGPGFGDEAVFRAEHDTDPDLEAVIGFTPTHDLVVVTEDHDRVSALMTIQLAAMVQEVVGGAVEMCAGPRLAERLRALPGVIAVAGEGEPRQVYGDAEFLRAWAAHPEFGDYFLRHLHFRNHW